MYVYIYICNNSKFQYLGRNKILDARRGGINEQFPPKYLPLSGRKYSGLKLKLISKYDISSFKEDGMHKVG